MIASSFRADAPSRNSGLRMNSLPRPSRKKETSSAPRISAGISDSTSDQKEVNVLSVPKVEETEVAIAEVAAVAIVAEEVVVDFDEAEEVVVVAEDVAAVAPVAVVAIEIEGGIVGKRSSDRRFQDY